MSQVIKFSDAVVLGFHAMLRLAQSGECGLRMQEIADNLSVSGAHLSKVMQRLRKVGLINAGRGPSGGYRLAGKPADISLESIYEAIDGPILTSFCLFQRPVCMDKSCGLGNHIGELNQKLKAYLSKTTLASLLKKSR
ncbi:MAG: Rrf2 family transcriptional regulator [Candidatus Ozemobacteraceae bacterium]